MSEPNTLRAELDAQGIWPGPGSGLDRIVDEIDSLRRRLKNLEPKPECDEDMASPKTPAFDIVAQMRSCEFTPEEADMIKQVLQGRVRKHQHRYVCDGSLVLNSLPSYYRHICADCGKVVTDRRSDLKQKGFIDHYSDPCPGKPR